MAYWCQPLLSIIYHLKRTYMEKVSWIMLFPFVESVVEMLHAYSEMGRSDRCPSSLNIIFFITSPNKPTKYLSCLLGDSDTCAALKQKPINKRLHSRITAHSPERGLRIEGLLHNLSACGPNTTLLRITQNHWGCFLALTPHLWELAFLMSTPRWY